MKISRMEGSCVECGSKTNILLDNNIYACESCLKRVSAEQIKILNVLKIIYYEEDFDYRLQQLIGILEVMQENGCTKTQHCIDALKSFALSKKNN